MQSSKYDVIPLKIDSLLPSRGSANIEWPTEVTRGQSGADRDRENEPDLK